MVNPGKAENPRSPKSLKTDGILIRSTFWCRIRNCIATIFVSHLVLILPGPAWALSKVVKKRSKMMFSRFLHKVGSMGNEKMNPHMFITSTKIAQNRRSYRKIGTPEISALRGVTILLQCVHLIRIGQCFRVWNFSRLGCFLSYCWLFQVGIRCKTRPNTNKSLHKLSSLFIV